MSRSRPRTLAPFPRRRTGATSRAAGPAPGAPLLREGLDVGTQPDPSRRERLQRLGEPAAVDVGDDPALVPARDLRRLGHARQDRADLHDQRDRRGWSVAAQRLAERSPQGGQTALPSSPAGGDVSPSPERSPRRPPPALLRHGDPDIHAYRL